MLVIISGLQGIVYAQPVNDDCFDALQIPTIDSWCSGAGEYTNVGATAGTQIDNTCFFNYENDVWFSFTATTTAVLLQVFGNVNNQGTLPTPEIGVFEGSCGNLAQIGCVSSISSQNAVELTVGDLVVGQLYYVMVDGGGTTGTFQLCLNGFNPPKSPEADCSNAVVLCDKSPFSVESLIGTGNDPNEVEGTCLSQEFASAWYKWTCRDAGTLTFTLTPNNFVPGFEPDDLDFAVYELPDGIDDCANKTLIRCMASGAQGGCPFSIYEPCTGPTGLSEASSDTIEEAGCYQSEPCEGIPGPEQGSPPQIDDNFLAAIDMEVGKSYALIVNNFSQSGLGFSIEFGGTGTFLGPEPDFEVEAVEAFECDKTIIFTDESSSQTDSIVNWQWNFGVGSVPSFTAGSGPHDVVYESFGDKIAALTVESSRGCIVTKILPLYVEPCCADTSTLDVLAEVEDLICPGVPTGEITGIGISGAPRYQFSLDGENFQINPNFDNLPDGNYTLFIQDQKGCRDSTFAIILDAPPFFVDAGDTIEVNLGDPAQLNAIPNTAVSSVMWDPNGSLEFGQDSLSPLAFAPGTTVYTVTVSNAAGCVASDRVVVLVNVVRPLYIPNVISANGDGVNDYFTLYSSGAADIIEILRIFNRWGALVYEGTDIPLGDELLGWDGRFKDQLVNPGVFAYYAKVRFLDNVSFEYTGTVTVVR